MYIVRDYDFWSLSSTIGSIKLLPASLWSRMGVPVRVSFLIEIDKFKNYWYKIVIVFGSGPGYQASISGRVVLKTQNMVLDASLLNRKILYGMDQG